MYVPNERSAVVFVRVIIGRVSIIKPSSSLKIIYVPETGSDNVAPVQNRYGRRCDVYYRWSEHIPSGVIKRRTKTTSGGGRLCIVVGGDDTIALATGDTTDTGRTDGAEKTVFVTNRATGRHLSVRFQRGFRTDAAARPWNTRAQ